MARGKMDFAQQNTERAMQEKRLATTMDLIAPFAGLCKEAEQKGE